MSSGIRDTGTSNGGWNNIVKEVKCWGCNGPHLYRNCSHNPNKKMAPINMVHEASTINDIARNILRINVALEDRKADHQSTMLEVEGKISNTSLSFLIDPGASLSYIPPRVLEKCKLSKKTKECMVGISSDRNEKGSH